MRKVKCVSAVSSGFTLNKVYDVIRYIPTNVGDAVFLFNDFDKSGFFYLSDTDRILFIDATSEFRNETIDNILN